jgi:putative DNA primase/helicase
METNVPTPNNIPPELREYPNWVCGDANKVPFNPKNAKKALANVPGTWGTYEEAVRYSQRHRENGINTIGFEMDKSPFTGIDLDRCRNQETGEIDPWALEIIRTLDSYTEISPSGTGIRIFVTAGDDFPSVNRKKGGLGESGKGVIEIANTGKYFSVTGNHLEGTPDWIGFRPEELRKVYNKYFPAKATEATPTPKTHPPLADNEIFQRAGKAANGAAFKKLFSGDWSNYPSQSEADLALCCMLAFWCGKDAEHIEQLFKQSGLCREKWDREDYRTQTIQRAIETTSQVYQERDKRPTTPFKATLLEGGRVILLWHIRG